MWRRIVLIAVWLSTSVDGWSQAKPISITSRDKNAIENEAERILHNYETNLRLLADQGLPPSERKELIDGSFSAGTVERIFLTSEATIDDETDPGADPKKPGDRILVRNYLEGLNYNFKQEPFTEIQCKKSEFSKIRIVEAGLELRLWFTQTMTGMNLDGKEIPRKINKVMIFMVDKNGSKWQVLVRRIEFASRPDATENAPVVTVTGGRETERGQAGTYSEAYYASALQKGRELLAQGNYAMADYYFLEASENSSTTREAGEQIKEVARKIREKGLDPFEVISDKLISEGDYAQEKFLLERARKLYTHAHSVNNTSKAATLKLEKLSSLDKNIQQLFSRFERGTLSKEAAEDALAEFKSASAKDRDNPYWDAGMALAYAHLGNVKDAEASFERALKKYPDNPDIYQYLAGYYRMRRDFEKAYSALHNVQVNAEDPQSPALLAEIAYIKGKALMTKGDPKLIKEALDSFNRAEHYLPSFKEARIGQADALASPALRDFSKAKKILDELLREDNSLGEAQYLRSYIWQKENQKDKAIEALISANTNSKNNAQYTYELGDLLIEQARILDAIPYFDECSKINNKLLSETEALKEQNFRRRAIWKLGKCNYLLNDLVSAEKNYNLFYESCFNKRKEPLPYATIPMDFYADIASLYVRKNDLAEASKWLNMEQNNAPVILLSRGILSYRKNEPSSLYQPWIDQALKNGLLQNQFENAPFTKEICDNNREVRKMVTNRWPNIKLRG